MIILVRGPAGMCRINMDASATLNDLYVQAGEQLKLNPDAIWTLKHSETKAEIARNSDSLTQANLKHGTMLNVVLEAGVSALSVTSASSNQSSPMSHGFPSMNDLESRSGSPLSSSNLNMEVEVVEDEVDQILSKCSGVIERQFDPIMCNHNRHGKCSKCVSLEPFDEEYRQENGIKHMSFQSYVRYLQRGADKGKFSPLNEIRVTILEGCSHAPWPEAICTRCQPSAITLKRQVFRNVDYVQFESPEILEHFLEFWRKSGGQQRLGYLIGKHESFDDVPLGVKARVVAIYEPPQNNDALALQVNEEDNAILNELCEDLGLKVLGYVFTDLEDDGTLQGKVQFKRHKDSFFLSSHECLMSADLQNKYEMPCKIADKGKFSSKFVTVCVSGDKENQVALEAYQVSNQTMALAKADILRPSKIIGKGAIKKSSNEQYVPDVFYSYKDEYGNEVSGQASPSFPLDFLIVNVSSGTPANQGETTFSFGRLGDYSGFPIENRDDIRQGQDMAAIKKHFDSYADFLSAMSDFHLLLHLKTSDVYGVQDKMKEICEAVKNKDSAAAEAWRNSPEWATVTSLMSMTGDGWGASQSQGSSSDGFVCIHCTFKNTKPSGDCEICSLPQN